MGKVRRRRWILEVGRSGCCARFGVKVGISGVDRIEIWRKSGKVGFGVCFRVSLFCLCRSIGSAFL